MGKDGLGLYIVCTDNEMHDIFQKGKRKGACDPNRIVGGYL